jgi:RecA/RadA recombinase
MLSREGVLDPLTQFGAGALEKNQTYLVYGESGVGKTLFCLLAALSFAKQKRNVLYASTENISVVNKLSALVNSHFIDHSVLDEILLFQIRTQKDEAKIPEVISRSGVLLVVYDSATHIYSTYISENTKLIILRNKLFTNFLACMHSIRKKRDLSIVYTSKVLGAKNKAVAHNALAYFSDWHIWFSKKSIAHEYSSYFEANRTQRRYSYTIDNLGFAAGE